MVKSKIIGIVSRDFVHSYLIEKGDFFLDDMKKVLDDLNVKNDDGFYDIGDSYIELDFRYIQLESGDLYLTEQEQTKIRLIFKTTIPKFELTSILEKHFDLF